MRLIIDRFEGDYAVCEDENMNMVNIEKTKLPEDAREGFVLIVQGGRIKIDYDETAERKKRIKEKMDSIWD
ncbi:MAG: DUF3006 domain-containing protein [Clostridiales bacterium]|jgi:hypothetical protein|nr:DUF3006 domain-containing protein [Clostridiales bacterium]